MRKTKYLALLLVVPALALTACGSSSKSSSDKDQITDIVNSIPQPPKPLMDAMASGNAAPTENVAADASVPHKPERGQPGCPG